MDGFAAGFVTALLVVGILSVAGYLINASEEVECEREYNVYDCEQDPTWYPVYNPEIDYEEDTP
jgi:hypothetical protein